MKRIMYLLILVVVIFPAMVSSAQAVGWGGEERVIIREGYTVPDGKILMIDELTVLCRVGLTQPEQVDSIRIPPVMVMVNINTPDPTKCREPLINDKCNDQIYSIGAGASVETLPGFGGAEFRTVELVAGRQMDLVAYGGATILGWCIMGYPPEVSPAPEIFIHQEILSGMGRLKSAPKR